MITITAEMWDRSEKRNACGFPAWQPIILDNQGCLQSGVFVSLKTLGWAGNGEIPDNSRQKEKTVIINILLTQGCCLHQS